MNSEPNIDWKFYWVSQEDSSYTLGFSGSISNARGVINTVDPLLKGRIELIEVAHQELARIRSVKGGSIIIGMAESISPAINDAQKPDYIFYSDMSMVPNLAQVGRLLSALIENDESMVIGSRRLRASVGRRTWFRRLFSYLLNKWSWLYHRDLRLINDSQAGCKPGGVKTSYLRNEQHNDQASAQRKRWHTVIHIIASNRLHPQQ